MTRSRDLANLADSTEFTSADNTKLDGIEASATADQTNAEIKTAVQANSDIALAGNPTTTTQTAGNNSTRIATTAYADTAITNLVDSSPAAMNTLNELAAALGDDANFSTTVTNSIATKLPLAGGAVTGNVTFGDNNKAIFGSGSDLQIYHDGSNSYITDAGDGDLILTSSTAHRVRTNQFQINNNANNEEMISAVADGAVTLRHNGLRRLDTTSTGIDITGALTVATLSGSVGTNPVQQWQYSNDDDWMLRLRQIVSSGLVKHTFDLTNAGTDYNNNLVLDRGNVGINNASPSAKLDVVTNDNVYVGEFHQQNTSNGDGVLIQVGSTAAADYALTVRSNAGNNSVIAAKADGKVGIGTFTPSALLNLAFSESAAYSSTGEPREDIIIHNTNGGDGAGVNNHATLGFASGGGATSRGFINYVRTGDNTGDFTFSQRTGGSSYAEALRINSSGNVGIGLSSPTAPLTIKSPANAEAIHIVGRSDDIGQIIFFEADASTNLARIDARNNVFNVQSNAAIPMTLGTSSTARVTVETNGDLTIEDGNLVIGTSGHGIDFSATANGTSSTETELLDDYEEGAFTPTMVGTSNTPTFYNISGKYTKVGRVVTAQLFIQTNASPTFTSTSAEFKIGGFPFAVLGSGYTGSQGSVNAQAMFYHGTNNNQQVSGSATTGGCYLTCAVNADEQMTFQVTNSGGTRGIVNNAGAAQGMIVEATITYFTT